MYQIKTDLHTHTVFSGHAYSTLEENVRAAAEAGMEALAITDHYSEFYNICVDREDDLFAKYGHYLNMKAVPDNWHGVRILSGVEADIVDFEGHILGYDKEIRGLRMDEHILGACDIRIASVHYFPKCRKGTILENTKLYCSVLENPLVQIIGHIGRAHLPFELNTVLLKAKEQGKIIEINEHSFDDFCGEEVHAYCRRIAVRCAELGVGIAVNSDAHCSYYVGRFDKASSMLEEIHFPEELIVNTNLGRLTLKLNL